MQAAEERYLSDPAFKRLVDYIFVAIREKQHTATEVRDAAMYAAIQYEQMHLRRYGALPDEGVPREKVAVERPVGVYKNSPVDAVALAERIRKSGG